MNANELADWIDERNISASSQTLGKAATMLRQQQADKQVSLEIIKCHEQTISQKHAEIEALKEKMCKAIYEEAAYCYDTGGYMLDYSDCQEIIRGTWVRPLYAGQEDSAILRKVNRK